MAKSRSRSSRKSRSKNQTRKAKICQRKGKRLVCRDIRIRSDVWPDGAFDSYEKLLKAAKRMVKKDGYATVIRRLNIIRIWNRNRNPRLVERIEKVMEKLRKLKEAGKL